MNSEQLRAEGLAAAAKVPADRSECPDHDYIFMEGYMAGAGRPVSNKDKALSLAEQEYEAEQRRLRRSIPEC